MRNSSFLEMVQGPFLALCSCWFLFDGPSFASPNVGRRGYQQSLIGLFAAPFQPSLDLFEVPGDTTRRQTKVTGKFTSMLKFVIGLVSGMSNSDEGGGEQGDVGRDFNMYADVTVLEPP